MSLDKAMSQLKKVPQLDNLTQAFRELIRLYLAYITKRQNSKTISKPKPKSIKPKPPLEEAMQDYYWFMPRTFGSNG